MAFLRPRPARRLLAGALVALSVAPAAWGAPSGCPDLSGHYRVDGFGPVLGDALQAMGAEMAGFRDSEVRFDMASGTELAIHWKSGGSGTLPTTPNRVLVHRADFTCSNGWLAIKRAVPATRRTDQGFFEGRSEIRMRPAPGRGLNIVAEFSGGQRETLYSYDSARISIPKLGSGRKMTESIRWPDISEAVAAVPRPSAPQSQPLPKEEAAVKGLLTHAMLGGMILGPVKPQDDAILVYLTATRSEDVVAFEDRMRDAGIGYQVRRSPFWSNNVWQLQLLMWPDSPRGARPWRPSTLRVEHELQRRRDPLVYVAKVEDKGYGGYLATLQLQGQAQLDPTISRILAAPTPFIEVAVVSEPGAGEGGARTAKLLVRLR